MQKTILALQQSLGRWRQEVDQFIETWFFIDSLGREVLEHRLACEISACDAKAFGKFHVYSTCGRLTNDVGSNKPCRLRRALEKLCPIHFQLAPFLRFEFSVQMRWMLSESILCWGRLLDCLVAWLYRWGRCPVLYNNVLYLDGGSRRSPIEYPELKGCLELSITSEFQHPYPYTGETWCPRIQTVLAIDRKVWHKVLRDIYEKWEIDVVVSLRIKPKNRDCSVMHLLREGCWSIVDVYWWPIISLVTLSHCSRISGCRIHRARHFALAGGRRRSNQSQVSH